MAYITILSIIGFINAFFLHWQYKRFLKTKKPMFCLIGEDCTKVVSSSYGSTWGIKNEVLGMWYYAVILILFLVSNFVSSSFVLLGILIFIITFIAAAFSLYLLYAQTIILKNLCSWCLIAITINILIFILAAKLVV